MSLLRMVAGWFNEQDNVAEITSGFGARLRTILWNMRSKSFLSITLPTIEAAKVYCRNPKSG